MYAFQACDHRVWYNIILYSMVWLKRKQRNCGHFFATPSAAVLLVPLILFILNATLNPATGSPVDAINTSSLYNFRFYFSSLFCICISCVFFFECNFIVTELLLLQSIFRVNCFHFFLSVSYPNNNSPRAL